MKCKHMLLPVALALLSSYSNAQPNKDNQANYSGTRLVHDCKSAIVDYDSSSRSALGSDAEHCIGYIQGAIEMALMWQLVADKTPNAQAPLFCLTKTSTNEVIIRQVPIWAIEHPEDNKGMALELLLSMLHGRYPCTK